MGTEATVSAASLAHLSFCRCCVCGCAESRIGLKKGLEHTCPHLGLGLFRPVPSLQPISSKSTHGSL